MTSIITGLVTGFVGGYALQRGGFCMHSAFRSIAYEKDHSIVRAWLLVLAINIPALLLLEQLGLIFPARAPFSVLAGLIGGVVFGIGMVLAGGCVSGTYYRTSKGMTGSLVALLGFAAGGLMMTQGILRPLRSWALGHEILIAGEEASLYNLPTIFASGFFPGFGLRWIIAGVVVIAIAIFLLRAPKQTFTIGWPWWVTGIVIGVVAIGGWYFSSLEYRDYGLSIVQPTNAIAGWLVNGETGGINWTAWFLIGLVPGAFAAAWRGGDLSLRVPSAGRLLQNLGGGILMGWGANLAGGCNIGHGVTGMSVLSIGSIWATAATMLGVWAMTWLVFRITRSQAGAKPASA
ncbi:MAG: YeeE/YedE family protein [Spirochaetaceae bacterium]|nr:MAG: YeeE/YedE family protein [Spirochaetaceae bacterium]